MTMPQIRCPNGCDVIGYMEPRFHLCQCEGHPHPDGVVYTCKICGLRGVPEGLILAPYPVGGYSLGEEAGWRN